MILIGLGSSLSFCGLPPREIIPRAIAAIGQFAPVLEISRLYGSPAWPDPADPPFVNAVIEVEARSGPAQLLAALHQVEAAFGRLRSRRNAPRTLDLDLIAYDGLVIEGRGRVLRLPHPGLAARDFVLAPLIDVAPDWISPATGLSARDMLAELGRTEARVLED